MSAIPDFTDHLLDEGRFHLTEILGAGTYGTVYKALDTRSSPDMPTHYAIKCLGPVLPPQRCATFHRRFSHHGCLFIVLELSAGGHLFDAIDHGVFRNDTLDQDVFFQLIETVRFFHERGVYHRNLKPENILCSAEGEDIRIADFGLATDCALPA
ncbi:kinase-like domain-containing protein [Mycena epipterygia]|nr:kinase-like domain-containing protein [Mycena epipterygia]